MSILNYEQLLSLPKDFNYTYVTEININGNHLKTLSNLNLEKFTKLKILNCSNNKLEDLNGISKCIYLEDLDCSNNKLKNLDNISDYFSLQKINCTSNYITDIKGISNCIFLKTLICNYNKITKIDCLSKCTLLQIFYCNNNMLSDLNGLSNCLSLQGLNCSNNMIENLEGISNCTSLQIVFCNNNKLKNLLPIINLKRLKYIYYNDNPFEGLHHPAVLRILNKNRIINSIYNDAQNVHDSEITRSVYDSINYLLKAHSNSLKNKEQIISKLFELKFKKINELLSFIENEEIHFYFNLSYFEVFQLVFSEIEKLNFNPELIRRLEEEINDSYHSCFTGKIIRTVNSLNSFSDLVNIKISQSSQINAVMSTIKNDFDKNKIKKEDLLKVVKKRLLEYTSDEKEIETYLEIFSEMYLE